MVNFKEIYLFQGSRGGPTFSRGGGGSNCLFPITCDFPGGVRTPCPPLWIRTWGSAGLLTPRVAEGGGWGVCGQNICYYVAAFVIPFNLICDMTIIWKSWILTFWPQPLSPLRGSNTGLQSKITFDMFILYCTSVCMQNFSKKYWQVSYCKI